MNNIVAQERQVVESLLASTGKSFEESTPDISPALRGTLAGWRFTTHNEAIIADIFVIEGAETRQAALERLIDEYLNDNEPLVSYNGRLVFAVRYKGKQSDKHAFTARDIASALSGEEE